MALPQSERLGWLLEQSDVPQAAVEAVCQARRRELDRLGIPVVPVGPDHSGGRILFTTMDTDSCEASISSSKGFYDPDDLPGWDTWFWHRPTDRSWGAIWCWIPGPLIGLATDGMDVIPTQCVEWAEPLEWPKRD